MIEYGEVYWKRLKVRTIASGFLIVGVLIHMEQYPHYMDYFHYSCFSSWE